MIADLKPYPAMKDSGVEWLGAVPEHWEVRRLRNTSEMRVSNVDKHAKDDEQPVRLCNYVDVYKNERIRSGMAFMRATATTDEIERFRLQSGDVLITKDSEAWNDIGVPALVEDTQDDIVSGYHLALLRPFPERVDGGYLFRALQSTAVTYQFHVEANGVTRYGLSHSAIKSVWLPLAPLPEQSAIVRFLDHADRRIRRYTRAKEKLIALLEEQKQALIHQIVTRGLDPNVRLKPSGVEWLGEVPENWKLERGKWLFRKMDRPIRDADEVVTCFRDGIVTLRKNRRVRGFTESLKEIGYQGIRRGDLVIHGMDAFAGAIGVADSNGKGTPVYSVCEPGPSANPQYYAYTLREMARSQWIQALTKGIRERSTDFRFEGFGSQPVPLPPLPEQAAIVRFLDEAAANIDDTINRSRRQIELLSEYRTRLIADVVTGKLDVREAAASLLEEADERDPLDEVVPLADDVVDNLYHRVGRGAGNGK